MATEFGAENTSVSEVQSSSTAKSGVSKGPSFVEGLSNVFDQATGLLQERKAEKNTKLVSDFTKQQLLEAEAVSQGTRSTSAAQTRMRRNLIAALDANPMLQKELLDAQRTILNLPGAGKIAVDGTLAEQRTNDRNDRLVQAGYAPPDATDQEFEIAAQEAEKAMAAKKRYDSEIDRINLELKRDDLTKSRRDELEAARKNEAERFITDNSRAEYNILSRRFEDILASDASEAEKIIQIKEHYADWNSQVSGMLGTIDSDMRTAMQRPFDSMVENYLARASGEIGDAEVERRNKRIVTQMNALALADPEIAKMVSVNKLLGSEGLLKVFTSGNPKVAKALMRFMAGLDPDSTEEAPSVFTNEAVSKEALKTYLKSVTDELNLPNGEAKDDATAAIQSTLENIEDNAGHIARSPDKAIALIDWLSSPSFLNAMKKNPDAFTNLDGIKDILDRNYHDEVAGLIRSQFLENKVELESDDEDFVNRLMNDEPTEMGATSLVKAVSNSSGMTFTAIDPDNAVAVKEAARLNKTLKPIINNSLKAQAHLSGRNDYGQMWEEVSGTIFGGNGDTQAPGGDEGDDLVMENFLQEIETAEPAADEEINDMTTSVELPSGGTMEKVSGMIIHQTGGRGDVDTVVRVLQERNLSVQYVIDREGTIHQLMPDNAVAWHAGKNNKSKYNNKTSPGVEIIANDNNDVTPEQVSAAQRLIARLAKKHGFDPQQDVKGHGEVATHKRPTEGMAVLSELRRQ